MRSLTIVAVLLLVASPAAAVESQSIEFKPGRDNTALVGHVTRRTGSSARAQPSTSSRSQSDGPGRPAIRVVATKRSIAYIHPNGVTTELLNTELRDFCRGTSDYSTCYAPYDTERPRRRRRPPPPPPPELIAERTIVNLPLPTPDPQIDPGYAITGLRAYLETGDVRRRTWHSVDTVLGPLRVDATSTYTVDWGDGTSSGPHSSTGGEYPDGDITHVYQRTGLVDVVVTQSWTANWSLAGRTGTVNGLRTSGLIDDMAVREVQATRDR